MPAGIFPGQTWLWLYCCIYCVCVTKASTGLWPSSRGRVGALEGRILPSQRAIILSCKELKLRDFIICSGCFTDSTPLPNSHHHHQSWTTLLHRAFQVHGGKVFRECQSPKLAINESVAQKGPNNWVSMALGARPGPYRPRFNQQRICQDESGYQLIEWWGRGRPRWEQFKEAFKNQLNKSCELYLNVMGKLQNSSFKLSNLPSDLPILREEKGGWEQVASSDTESAANTKQNTHTNSPMLSCQFPCRPCLKPG